MASHGYNLGHHRIPSNKFLLYDHATRIPGVISGETTDEYTDPSVLGTKSMLKLHAGPGIKPGEYPVLVST